MKVVTEERVEPVQVQVMKYVAEERTVQVPRVVEKKTPYTYTVRMPRTVVTKVPLDPCGNPLPAASAPAAAARPAAAPALSQQAATGPVKTFSDRPADAAAKTESGWGASSLPHVDPSAAPADGAVRAERPATEAAPAEAIPSPTPRAEAAEPTVAPVGPSVEPAPPAHDQRDVPATGTSGRPILRSLHSGQTT
jgi:hypothetical protein